MTIDSTKMGNAKSLKWNTAANYVGLGYTTIIAIVILPLYLQYLGAEAFGLVGFFTVLQAWMQLFDMGMSPLLSRQTAHVRGQVDGFLELRKLLRSLEIIILFIAVFVCLTIAFGSDWVANQWLNLTTLALSEVAICITLMGVMIGLRFFALLYRSGIQGMENQIQMNVANIVIVTLKFVGALLLLQFVTQDLVYFFIYQLIIGVVELSILAAMFYRLLPPTGRVGIRFFWSTLKPVLPFTAGLAYTAVIWVLLTQLDKIILSTVMPLSEYGYFTLVVVVATGITKISNPISQAILPRMTHLLSQGREQEMLSLYRKSTQLMAVIMLPLTGVIVLFSTELLFAWTGDKKAAEWAGPILSWFALGNGILVFSAFQYYLQFAHGKLKMHVIYNTISACIQIPLIVYVAYEYGALGVAVTWFTVRLVTFVAWVPFVHGKFAPGIHWPWLLKDVMPILFSTVVLLYLFDREITFLDDLGRMGVFSVLFGMGLVVLMGGILMSSLARGILMAKLKKLIF